MVSLSQDKLLIHALGIGVVRMVALSCFARHPPDPRPLVDSRRGHSLNAVSLSSLLTPLCSRDEIRTLIKNTNQTLPLIGVNLGPEGFV